MAKNSLRANGHLVFFLPFFSWAVWPLMAETTTITEFELTDGRKIEVLRYLFVEFGKESQYQLVLLNGERMNIGASSVILKRPVDKVLEEKPKKLFEPATPNKEPEVAKAPDTKAAQDEKQKADMQKLDELGKVYREAFDMLEKKRKEWLTAREDVLNLENARQARQEQIAFLRQQVEETNRRIDNDRDYRNRNYRNDNRWNRNNNNDYNRNLENRRKDQENTLKEAQKSLGDYDKKIQEAQKKAKTVGDEVKKCEAANDKASREFFQFRRQVKGS